MTSVTIHLPDLVYQRVKNTADSLSLPLEHVIAEAVDILLPALERDLPSGWQAGLAAMPLLNDTQLWKVAHQQMDTQQQTELEALAETQKHRTLSAEEQKKLDDLMQTAQHVMLSKAEAYRLLVQRGHTIFSTR